jgi:hypothetical protein
MVNQWKDSLSLGSQSIAEVIARFPSPIGSGIECAWRDIPNYSTVKRSQLTTTGWIRAT